MAENPFANVGVNPGVDIGGLNPVFSARMQNLINAAEAATGAKVQITSGYRTPEHQAQIYADWTQKPVSYGGKTYTPKGPSGIIAAKPGNSEHQAGTAMDISPHGAAYQWMVKNAPKYGIQSLATVNGKRYDLPHFQLTRSDMALAQAGKLPMPPGMNVPEVGTALAYTGATPPLPRVDPRSALGAIGNATQPSLANWFANGPDRAQVSPASTDVAWLYNGILPPQGAQFGGDAGLALGMNPALEAEAQAATNPPKFGVTQTFQNGLPLYSLPPQPNSSGSPDERNQSLSAILAQAASGNTVPSQPYPQAATGNTYASQPLPQAATGNTLGYQPGPQAATGNTVGSQPLPQAATGNTVPSIPAPIAATGQTIPSPVQPYAGYIPGLGGGQTSPSTTVPLPRPDPRGVSAKQYLNAEPARPTGRVIPDPTYTNTPYDVNFPPSSTMLGGVSKMTPPAALQGASNVLGGLSSWFAGTPSSGTSNGGGFNSIDSKVSPLAAQIAAVPQSRGPAGGYYAPPTLAVPQRYGPAGGSYSSPYDDSPLSGSSTMAMNDPTGLKNTRSGLAAPTYTTQSVLNPAYTAWANNQAVKSPFTNPGVQGLSPDDRDSPNGIAQAVPGLTSPVFNTPAPPKYISQKVLVKPSPVVPLSPPQDELAALREQAMNPLQRLFSASPMGSMLNFATGPAAYGGQRVGGIVGALTGGRNLAQMMPMPTPLNNPTPVSLLQQQGYSAPVAYSIASSKAAQQAANPNQVMAAITGNSGSGQIRGGAIA